MQSQQTSSDHQSSAVMKGGAESASNKPQNRSFFQVEDVSIQSKLAQREQFAVTLRKKNVNEFRQERRRRMTAQPATVQIDNQNNLQTMQDTTTQQQSTGQQLPPELLIFAPQLEQRLKPNPEAAEPTTVIERTLLAINYLLEIVQTNTTISERDCAFIFGFQTSLVRGQYVQFAGSDKGLEDFDFDKFHSEVVEKTGLLNSISQVVKMDKFTPKSTLSDEQSADGSAISAGLFMKIHAVNILSQLCLNSHNGENLCSQFLITQDDGSGLIEHFNMVFTSFNQLLSDQNSMMNPAEQNVTLELLLSSLNLIANINTVSVGSIQIVLQRTPLIDVMVKAAQHKVCSGKMLSALVFLASVLAYNSGELGLTRDNKVRLCQSVGKPGLISLEDRVVSDACWLFSYLLDCEDDLLIEQICEGTVVQLLVKQLSSQDINVRVPALKATANLLTCEEPEIIVNKALFEGAIERMIDLAQAPEFNRSSQVLCEVCFALSNIAAGSEGQITRLLQSEKNAWAFIKDHLLDKPVDIAQHKEAFKAVTNVVQSCSDAQLNMLVIPGKDQMLDLFTKLNKAVEVLKTDQESVNNYFESILSVFQRIGKSRIPLASEAFERASGLDVIEKFQQNQAGNEEIVDRCQYIIKEYFEVEEQMADQETNFESAAGQQNATQASATNQFKFNI